MELVTRPRFYLHIAEEVEYLARKAGPETALRWHCALVHTIQQLLRHPYIGRRRTDLKPSGIRSLARGTIFRVGLSSMLYARKTVVLLRVRYGMMNLSTLEFDK